jgi:hypothetical protein
MNQFQILERPCKLMWNRKSDIHSVRKRALFIKNLVGTPLETVEKDFSAFGLLQRSKLLSRGTIFARLIKLVRLRHYYLPSRHLRRLGNQISERKTN